jgi:hypothetical protein
LLKDRQELEKKLIVLSEQINDKKEKTDKITNIMMEHGISPGAVANITEQLTSISLLHVSVLYLFTCALFEVTRDINIKP